MDRDGDNNEDMRFRLVPQSRDDAAERVRMRERIPASRPMSAAISSPNATVSASINASTPPDNSQEIHELTPSIPSPIAASAISSTLDPAAEDALASVSVGPADQTLAERAEAARRGHFRAGDRSFEARGYRLRAQSGRPEKFSSLLDTDWAPHRQYTQALIYCISHVLAEELPQDEGSASYLARIALNKLLHNLRDENLSLQWHDRAPEPRPPPAANRINLTNAKLLPEMQRYLESLKQESSEWPRLLANYENLKVSDLPVQSRELHVTKEIESTELKLEAKAARLESLSKKLAVLSQADLLYEDAEEVLDNLRARTRPKHDTVAILQALMR